MRRSLFFSLLCGTLMVLGQAITFRGSSNDRVLQLISQMTIDEKISLMHGEIGTYIGNTPEISRLGIPALRMHDGPQGFRATPSTGGSGTTTAWPSALSIAASWDEDLVSRWAVAMAAEFSAKGANMALAPGIGIARVPVAGRNFEYLCGEDPILGSKLVKPIISGFQDNGILANAKHFINNEIETNRKEVSSNVDERTRFELYYPPFQAAIDSGVLTVMCSYNRINDVYACENPDTLGHLRNDLGFQGFIVSDWLAMRSTVQSLNATNDIEMPNGIFYSSKMLKDKLSSGEISSDEIDRAVGNILYAMDKIGLLDRKPSGDPLANVTSDSHNALAREIAAKSTVLVKNNNVLPLDATNLGECIAVIGDDHTVSGGGSGHVDPPYVITPAMGIQNALKEKGNGVTTVLYNNGKDISEATELAKKCTYTVVVVATSSTEGNDRSSLSLGNNQDELISSIAAVNKNIVVDMNIPGAILMPWVNEVPAILVSWMPGQEAGNALADVLFGSVNPSGRLPVTIPNKENEVGFSQNEYPGIGIPPEAAYHEQLLIGYRWYDANDVKPLFPFGHGLSYTSFAYSNIVSKVLSKSHLLLGPSASKPAVAIVSFTLENAGKVDGAEVVQLYVQYPSSAGEPPKQLRALQKVQLKSSERQDISLTLTQRDCSIWDVSQHSWVVPKGIFTVFVGASVQDIRLQTTFNL